MAASDFDLELVELRRKSVGRLVAAEAFDQQAFDDLWTYLCEKAELIKQEHVISKQVISLVLEAAAVIESRAPRVEGARKNAHLVMQHHNLLGLLAHGEGCADRVPGVARVK
jgi:hypothetical protein